MRNVFGVAVKLKPQLLIMSAPNTCGLIPSRAGVCFVFAFRALSERFQSAFRALSVPFQGGGQKWAPTPSPERPTVVRRSSDGAHKGTQGGGTPEHTT